MKKKRTIQRRDALRQIGGLGLAGITGLTTCTSAKSSTDANTSAIDGGTAAADCVLVPQSTAGPFYFDANQIRSDITEGRPGVPLGLELTVVDAAGCEPIADAVVDVWHTDAAGIYSGYAGQGDNGDVDAGRDDFMRGIQVTSTAGKVLFETVYPGWYPSRTIHIHFTVRPDENTEATSQLYFPDGVSDAVMALSPYSDRPGRSSNNGNDGVLRASHLEALLMSVTEVDGGYFASHTIGIAVA